MRIAFPLLLIILANIGWAQELRISPLRSPVQDEAEILSEQFTQNYAATLAKIYNQGGPQLQVVTVNSLQGYPIEEFTIRLAEKWQIGREGKNDGVILVVAPSERQVRIEVGSDLEGDLTDYDSHMIIQKIIVPYFKQGDFETGIGLAINAILKELNYDQYLQDQKYVTVQKHVQKNQGLSLLPFFLLFLLYPIIRKIFRNRFLTGLASGGILAGANYYVLVGAAGSMAIGVAIIMFIIGFVFGLLGPLNAAMLAGRGGIYGGRSGGGFGGGGWSGGGGGFSGGGASGRW